MNTTTIEWATHTWNPVTGCSPISEGCENCYAKRMAQRLLGRCGYPEDDPFKVTRHPKRLLQPLKLRKPSRILVCSMGDLFHEDVPDSWIRQVFGVMAHVSVEHHTFLILTKRPERMRRHILSLDCQDWGLPRGNIWLGVTVENNNNLWRIEELLQIPAAVRFVSIEPMLGPVELSKHLACPTCAGSGAIYNRFIDDHEECPAHYSLLHQVICGGETGSGARPMHPDWVRFLRDQCQAAGVPFLFKQWGEYREACAPDDPIWNGRAPKLRHEHGTHFIKLGAKKTGRILDGRIWDEYPGVTT